MMFKRKIYDKIKTWKDDSNGKTALLIEGARRIGKSTVVEEFAKNEYESYIMIDFSIAPQSVKALFEDISDLDFLFLQLQLQYHVDLIERKSLLIFDEVQLCPKARQAIKFLVKDHRYDYIETGFLISIKKNVKNILIPSEERKIEMYPMDFEEFRWALGDNATIPLLMSIFKNNKRLGDEINRKLMRDFRLYMLVGGMPQAVNEYIESNNFRKVDAVKRDILALYEDDFRKIDPTGRLSMMFDAIPAQLNKKTSAFKVNTVIGTKRVADTTILSLLSELKDSKTVLVAYHADNPSVGLSAFKDINKFKLYLADTGLFVTLMFKDRDFTENIIYEKLLNDKLSANLGYIYENVVAQILTANGNALFYYTFYKEETHRSYEIDFLIAKRNKICPIEVKSSSYRKHTSIDVFYNKFSDKILNRYILHTKDITKDKDIYCYPIYMTQFLCE